MIVRPLSGQVLVSVLPPDTKSAGGVELPEITWDGSPDKKPPFKGVVIAMGPWRKTKQGFGVLPPFGIGSTVLCTPYRGTQLNRSLGNQYRLVDADDVVAVLEGEISELAQL